MRFPSPPFCEPRLVTVTKVLVHTGAVQETAKVSVLCICEYSTKSIGIHTCWLKNGIGATLLMIHVKMLVAVLSGFNILSLIQDKHAAGKVQIPGL